MVLCAPVQWREAHWTGGDLEDESGTAANEAAQQQSRSNVLLRCPDVLDMAVGGPAPIIHLAASNLQTGHSSVSQAQKAQRAAAAAV